VTDGPYDIGIVLVLVASDFDVFQQMQRFVGQGFESMLAPEIAEGLHQSGAVDGELVAYTAQWT
jgi:hypothetical protein